MGGILSFFSDLLGSNREAYILILGLDASGKTTVMNRIRYGDNRLTIPTIGFECEHIQIGSLSFVGFDLGGQDAIRHLWHHYFENADAVVFVIDSNDRDRFQIVKDELRNLSSHSYLKDCPFLIFANKQDLGNAANVTELTERLDIHRLMHNTEWKMCESTATTGNGIEKGFAWLSNQV